MKKEQLALLPIIDLRSKWVDTSLMRAIVKKYQGTFVIQVMELTSQDTDTRRCRNFAIKVARDQRGISNVDAVVLSNVATERKSERLDGSMSLTYVRTMTFAFSSV